jgi:4-amino-4-deoxy-L-arabinose transferase-like glycosyltransferase
LGLSQTLFRSNPNSDFKRGATNITQTTPPTAESKPNWKHGATTFLKEHQNGVMLTAFLAAFAFAVLYQLGYMSVQWDEMPHLYGATLLLRMDWWSYMTTYGYYPPVFDLATTVSFGVFGINQVAGRLVALTFSVLAIALVYVFAKNAYGAKNALVAAIILGTMPGFFWLSRVTMLETTLIFFFMLVMFAFYRWINQNTNKALLFSGLALGIGVLAKYQIVVAAAAMLLSICSSVGAASNSASPNSSSSW